MKKDELNWELIDPIITRALEEDIGKGDITTLSMIPLKAWLNAEWVAKEECRLCGMPIVDRIFNLLDKDVKVTWLAQEGDQREPGKFGMIQGSARSILQGERTALNFIQRLSGIATLTNQFVEKTKKYGTMILDTRKTTPTLRVLEKYAVRTGGGFNHRTGLDKMVLMKENHQIVLEKMGINDWKDLVLRIRQDHPGIQVGIEADHINKVEKAIEVKADFVLLDNMAPDQIAKIVEREKGAMVFEASGGVTLLNVEAYAKTGVNRISLGALTHSFRSTDISLEVLGVK